MPQRGRRGTDAGLGRPARRRPWTRPGRAAARRLVTGGPGTSTEANLSGASAVPGPAATVAASPAAARRAAAACSSRCCAARSWASAPASPASALISARWVVLRRVPAGAHSATRYAAVRSPAPACDGAGIRPHGARAARVKPSAARASSGLPIASAAAVSTSAAAQAMSAACGRAGRAAEPAGRLSGRVGGVAEDVPASALVKPSVGGAPGRPARHRRRSAPSARRGVQGLAAVPDLAAVPVDQAGQADRVPGRLAGPGRVVAEPDQQPGRLQRREELRPGPGRGRGTGRPRGAGRPGPPVGHPVRRAAGPAARAPGPGACWREPVIRPGPAAAQFRQGQVRGQLPAAEPHRLPGGGAAAVHGDRVPGRPRPGHGSL